ncbi:unnamed protein product, partial [Effrenium voratum]
MAFRRHWLAFGDECAENGRRPLQEETRLEKYLGVPRRGGRREPRPTRAVSQELMKPIVRVLQAREMGSLSDHIQGVTCTAFHPTNPTLFSGSLDKARPSGLGVLVRPLCQSVKIFDLTRPPGHKKAFSVLQDVYAVHSICALLGVVLSPGIHPCGDFLFVGTAHQETGRSELDMPRLSVFIAAAVHRHSNVAKAFMSGRRRTGLLTLALSISWLALGPPPWTAASAPSWWRQGRPRKLHGSRAEVELLSQVARLLMPAEPLGELFRRFPAPAGWKGHYLDPDLAAYGVLNSPDAGLFVEYDGFWRHGEAEGRRNDARKTAALLAFAPPGSKVLRIGHFPLEEQTEAVQIRLKPWQGQGKSFANALSVLVRRMARDLGKDLCSAVRTRLIDFEEHGGCVDASHYAMSAHVRGADRNRTELLLPLRDLGMRKQEIAAVGVRCRPVGGSVRKTIMFLQIVGLSKAQIAKAVASFPSLLGYSIEDNLKPTVRWFAELGLNKAQIAKAVPTVRWFAELGLSKAQIAKAVAFSPQLLGYSIEDNLKPTVGWFAELGLSKAQIAKAVASSPQLLGCSIEDNLKPTVRWFAELGLSKAQIAKAVASFPQLLGYSIEDNLKPTVRWFAELGLSKAQIAKAVASFPQLLGCSISTNMSPKVVFLLTHFSAAELATLIARFPQLLGYSFARLQARVSLLVARGRLLQLCQAMTLTPAAFDLRYG